MTNEELAEIRAYVAERAAARARGEHIDSDERREAALLKALDEATRDLGEWRKRAWSAAERVASLEARVYEAERERDAARPQLAALHAAAIECARRIESHLFRNEYAQKESAREIVEQTIPANLTAAAREYEARIRADERVKALREGRSPCCNAAIRCGRCGHDLAHVAAPSAEAKVSPVPRLSDDEGEGDW